MDDALGVNRFSFKPVVLVGLLLVLGCRAPDGPMPLVDEDAQNRITDMARGLVTAGQAGEPAIDEWLSDDLEAFVERPTPEMSTLIIAVARAVSQALDGVVLTDDSARRLADDLWLAVSADKVSKSQIETLQEDTRLHLLTAGSSEEGARGVSDRVGALLSAVSADNRRWYQLF